MTNTSKMYRTNAKVKKWLVENGYSDINFFPHTRFIKDIHFQGEGFDGLASKGTVLVLFQCKSNCRATKKTMEEYKTISNKFGIHCLWFNSIDRKELEVNNEIQI